MNTPGRHIRRPGLVVVVTMILLFQGVKLHCQEWDFVKEKDGVMLYTRQEQNSSLLSFKGVVELHTTSEKVCTLIENVSNFDTWDDDIGGMVVFDHIKGKYLRYYLVYDLPWPVTDRDLCVEAFISCDSATGGMTLSAAPIPDFIPEKKEFIRIRKYWQTWTIQPVGNGMVSVILEGFADPAGSIPGWLYNMVILDTPFKMLSETQKSVEKQTGSH